MRASEPASSRGGSSKSLWRLNHPQQRANRHTHCTHIRFYLLVDNAKWVKEIQHRPWTRPFATDCFERLYRSLNGSSSSVVTLFLLPPTGFTQEFCRVSSAGMEQVPPSLPVNPSDRRPPKKDTLWLWFRHLKHKEPFEKSWTRFGRVTWCGRVAGCGRGVSAGTSSLNWTLDVTPAADVCTSPDGSAFKKNDFILFFLFQGKNSVEKCRRKSHEPTLLFLHSEHFVSFLLLGESKTFWVGK